tara:strand:+ start:7098 stop:7901 length:804 start_codon:yes stop_codon:yes gene_type:complete
MAKKLQLRRGTTSQHSSFTGAVGEVTVDTDKKVVVVHDGSTAGGVPLAKGADVVAVLDEDDMSTDSATRPPSQQSVKAYAQPLDADLTSLAGCQTGAAAALAALTSTEVAILDDAVVTTAELNYLDNVTSNVQTQLDAKQAADADTAKTDVDQEFTKPQRGDVTVATHSSGSTYDFDLDATNNFKLTISAAVELGFSNLDASREGQTGTIYIDNGAITPTWGDEVQFEGGTSGTISITQSKKSVLAYYVIPGGAKVLVTAILDVADD